MAKDSAEVEIKKVEDFIFNNKVQELFSDIKNRVMDFNILEITGMGSQEIKHSNILSWIFGNNEHGLGYKILEQFLSEIAKEDSNSNENKDAIKKLKHYVYLPEKKKDIDIYREKDNIDLLLVDKNNKTVIVVENKVWASESEEQLAKYEKIIEKNDNYKNYEKFYIFLTPNLDIASDEKWLLADYKMIRDAILHTKKEASLSAKTEIVLDSYIDLLIRGNIVNDKKLEELCHKIWLQNKEVLDILNKYRRTNIDILYDLILEKCDFSFRDGYFHTITTDASDKIYKNFGYEQWIDAEKWLFDIRIKKGPGHVWVGFYHPELKYYYSEKILNEKNNEYEKLLQIYNELTKKGVDKITEYTTIHQLVAKDVDVLNESDLQVKAEDVKRKIKEAIVRFEEAVKKIFGSLDT